MAVGEDDLEAVLRLAVDEDGALRAREPREVAPEELRQARRRDDEEVVVGELVGRGPFSRHRAEGDEADDARVGPETFREGLRECGVRDGVHGPILSRSAPPEGGRGSDGAAGPALQAAGFARQAFA